MSRRRRFTMTIEFEFDSADFDAKTATFREALRTMGCEPAPPGLGYELNGQLCSAFSLINAAAGDTVTSNSGRKVTLPVLRNGVDVTVEPDEFTTLRLQVTEHEER